MRRFIGPLAIIFITLWAAGAPASAATETQELNDTVSGPFSGTQEYEQGCAFFHQVFDLTVRPAPDDPHQPRMLGAIHIDTCVFPAAEIGLYDFSGTFVFTSSRGATLSGTVTGTGPGGTVPSRLNVTGGTSSFRGVSGHIDLSGTWTTDHALPVSHGTANGTSTGALVRPK
jgi:hypothetical protein